MADETPYRFNTLVIHAGQSPESWEGATCSPIFQTASHLHNSAENLSRAFAGETSDHIYMRLSNPTNRTLEEKLTLLEGGRGAIVMSSGMAALANTCMALLRSKARNLLERLRDFEADVLRFMDEEDVPFFNNQAENDLRMTKVQQKISGCFQSLDGAKIFCRIRSYLSTCRKQGLTASTALRLLFEGKRPLFVAPK
jgi:hypothetical protein